MNYPTIRHSSLLLLLGGLIINPLPLVWADGATGQSPPLVFPTTVEEIINVFTPKTLKFSPKNKDLEPVLRAGAKVNFKFDSAEILPDSYTLLNNYGQAFSLSPLNTATFAIEGHTDSQGKEDYNLKLSQRRAEAVRNYLVSRYPTTTNRLRVEAYGESKPNASNDTEEGRASNRRVEFRQMQ